MLQFSIIKNSEYKLRQRMAIHYSQPKGFVGRNICYEITYNNIYYGNIVWGSATKYLKGRYEFLGLTKEHLNNITNNLFYNISKMNNKYPKRNFTSFVLHESMNLIKKDWYLRYGDEILGYETLVEKPRTGELYKKAGWKCIGETKGFTCKRVSGISSDSWSGKRVWDTINLRPKLIFCFRQNGSPQITGV